MSEDGSKLHVWQVRSWISLGITMAIFHRIIVGAGLRFELLIHFTVYINSLGS